MGRLDPRIDFAGAGEGQHPQLTKVGLQLLGWPLPPQGLSERDLALPGLG